LACALSAALALSGPALGARVTLLPPHGRARVVTIGSCSWAGLGCARPGRGTPVAAVASAASAGSRRGGLTVDQRLSQLKRQRAITASEERGYVRAWSSALRTEKRLHGERAIELGR